MYGGTLNSLPTSELLSYDTQTEQWSSLPSSIYNVSGHTAHIIRGQLYIFFGQSAVYSFLSAVQAFDLGEKIPLVLLLENGLKPQIQCLRIGIIDTVLIDCQFFSF